MMAVRVKIHEVEAKLNITASEAAEVQLVACIRAPIEVEKEVVILAAGLTHHKSDAGMAIIAVAEVNFTASKEVKFETFEVAEAEWVERLIWVEEDFMRMETEAVPTENKENPKGRKVVALAEDVVMATNIGMEDNHRYGFYSCFAFVLA
jgi:hypothetical protein